MNQNQQDQKGLTNEEAKLAEDRMKKGLCPVCGQTVPWVCSKGLLSHTRQPRAI